MDYKGFACFIGVLFVGVSLFSCIATIPIYAVNYVDCQSVANARGILKFSTSIDQCFLEYQGKMVNAKSYDQIVFGNTLTVKKC